MALGWDDAWAAELATSAVRDGEPARVVRVERNRAVVVGGGDEEEIAGTASISVGDWIVRAGPEILATLPRSSVLVRRDPDGTTVQVLAANADLVAITVPADRPSLTRVERELAIAWASGAVPFVVITKCDLAPTLAGELATRLIGVDIVPTSARVGTGIDVFRKRLWPNRTAVLIGPSGAGKSSLANAVVGTDQLAVGPVRAGDHKGRHTTTSRQLVIVPTGGVLIDTPGLRGVGLVDDALDRVFPEIAARLGTCRFADCTHDGEPGCAIADGITSGRIDPERFDNYRKLADELERDPAPAAPNSIPRRRPGGQKTRRHEIPPGFDDDTGDEDDDDD